jgi:hypothetical protein
LLRSFKRFSENLTIPNMIGKDQNEARIDGITHGRIATFVKP